MKPLIEFKNLIALFLSLLISGCGLDTCLYTTECKATQTDNLSCSDLSATVKKRYTEEAMNALEGENFNQAITLFDCLINNDSSEHKNYARRGLAFVGRTGRYAPTTLLLNLSDPTFLATLQSELTGLAPSDLTDVDTLYQVGEDLLRGSADILTAVSLSSQSSSYQTIKWLAILYGGMGTAYIINSHKLYDAPNQLNTGVIDKIDDTRALAVKDFLDLAYQTSLDYANDSDSIASGLAVVSGAILLGLDYPQYLVNISISGERQGFINFLEQ